MTPRPESDSVEVAAESMAFGGMAVGRVQGKVVFVRGALPGERVCARIERNLRSHMLGQVTEVIKPSAERQASACPAFGDCGGCSFLHWAYPAQLRAKTQWIRDALRKFPKVADAVCEIECAVEPLHYRNRMSYSIIPSKGGTLRFGLHAARSNRILPTPACLLPTPGMLDLCHQAMDALRGSGIRPVRLDVRESRHSGERMLTLYTGRGCAKSRLAGLADTLAPLCRHLYQCEAVSGPLHRRRDRYRRLAGDGEMIERVGGLDFEITADTFFQTRLLQNPHDSAPASLQPCQ